jgi:hypothetical protein
MNPTEVSTDIHLRFNKHIESSDNTLNGKFQTRFITSPCQGCGSPEHSLLILSSDVINSDIIRYKYECPIVDGQPLYSQTLTGIFITYLLSARTYAGYYNYNLEEATSKTVLRNNHVHNTQPDHSIVFMNDVRRICIEHQRETELSTTQNSHNQTISKTTSNKRKLETAGIHQSQDSSYSTPPAKKPRKSARVNTTPVPKKKL